MALVTTTVTPEIRITPFTGVSEGVRERSGIARAEVAYTSYGIWPATAAGDNRSISFSYNLDPDYGYILMDSNCAFIETTAYIDMEATGVMEISTSGQNETESQWYQYQNNPSRQTLAGTTAIGSIGAGEYNTMYPITGANGVMAFTMVTKPTALLYPFPGVDDYTVTTMFGENRLNQGQIAYRYYTRFLQYDITQGYNYVVQTPALTR
jgi:hypothetical protein